MHVLKTAIATGALLLASGVAASCGSDSDSAGSSLDTEATSADGVTVAGAWSRTSPAMSTAGVVYFELTSSVDDELISVSVAGTVAAEAQIHQTTTGSIDDSDEMEMEDDAMDESDDVEMGEMMSMSQVHSVALVGGETVAFAPGGYHVMLMDLVEPLEEGAQFDAVLTFSNSDAQTITVTVSDSAS